MIEFFIFISLFVLHHSYAAPALQAAGSRTTSASLPNPTACGDIVKAESHVFNASTVHECLISVPFIPTVASSFIQYYNDTLQFQSTIAFLKAPPAGYQQPATDLVDGLARIQQAIDNGQFKDQYSFEVTLQRLIYSAHDAHLQLSAGVLAPFTFALPFEIASVSLDGKELPKVYLTSDLFANETKKLTWQPSAISKFNDQDATDYLTQFAAANSIGGLEPHADWNMLMQSPALEIQGRHEVLAGATTFYQGDTYTLTFENGTTLGPKPWLALYNPPGDTGPLETGDDFYNLFVLGLYPASYSDQQDALAASTASATPSATSAATSSVNPPTPTSWENPAYPDHPDVVQKDLAIVGGGSLSGYFLHDISVAVLSIPSFAEFGEAVGTFSSTIDNFIEESVKSGLKKVVIDLQQNPGGDIILATDAFKRFFPSIEPFEGSRRRVHPMANVLGDTWSRILADGHYHLTLEDYDRALDNHDLALDEWVILDRLSAATEKYFSSWAEYFDPDSTYNDDTFSAIERYNLSSFRFDLKASGRCGYSDLPTTSLPPYKAKDIVILTDGLCSSACAVFMEMMHHEAGVRTVVAGGRPTYGPMQSPAQSRGARMYRTDELDAVIDKAREINDTARALLPNRTINRDFHVTFASINLRDEVRQGENVPLQFLYEAANCRIFYTPQTWYNYSALWRYAADAIWTHPALCVNGPVDYHAATAGNLSGIKTPPSMAPDQNVQPDMIDITISFGGTPGKNATASGFVITIPDDSRRLNTVSGQSCSTGICPGHFSCEQVPLYDKGNLVQKKQCVPTCSSIQFCTNGAPCQFNTSPKQGPTGQSNFYLGVCIPTPPRFCGISVPNRYGAPPPPVGFDDEF